MYLKVGVVQNHIRSQSARRGNVQKRSGLPSTTKEVKIETCDGFEVIVT